MAAATRKSLASRAGAAARKVVSRGSSKKAPSPAEKAAKKAPAAKKTAPGKKTAPVTKAAVKAPAKKTAAKNDAAKKTAAKKTAAKKAPAKALAKKTPAKKTPTATKAPAKKAAQKTLTSNTAAPSPQAAKAPATKAAKKAPAKKAGTASDGVVAPDKLVVLEAEDPWTKAELKQVKAQLNDDVTRLTGELVEVEEDLAGMIENSGEGAGNDQADVGSASFERDQEMVIVNNARDMLEQSQHALERIADGTYGQCEICGNAIG
jgi:RNA polymerase-binding transcription factor DksA